MKCIALVIGIDHYNDADNYPELHTAVSDANAVATVLQEPKFEVDTALDADIAVSVPSVPPSAERNVPLKKSDLRSFSEVMNQYE